jgi:glycerate kinase
MNILLIPDKFKGSLSAEEVIAAITAGIRGVYPGATIHSVLASDGGDGFLEAVARYRQVELRPEPTVDPLGRGITAAYVMDRASREAYVELARASGLVLLEEEERNPGNTSTLGTGIQIKQAIQQGARKVYVGLGGSATNDGGTGIASALGYRFLGEKGDLLQPIGHNLERIDRIIDSEAMELLKGVEVFAVNDVTNPLLGPRGAAYVYGPQKGGSPEELERLEAGMAHLDTIVQQQLGKGNAAIAGTGAAGGTAYGLMTFANAIMLNGIEFILGLTGISEILESEKVDYIITGEGKLDEQTLSGKLIHGVLQLGKRHQIPVLAVCGLLDLPKQVLVDWGLEGVLETSNGSRPLAYNMAHAAELTEAAVRRFFGDRI